MNGMKNLIEMNRDGTDVVIDFKPRDGLDPQQRWISASDAWSLGLLLTGEAPPNALNFDTDWISLQMLNHPYQCAWLSMTGIRGGQTRRLTAYLEGGALARIGAALLELSTPTLLDNSPGQRAIRRTVSYFYVDRRCERRPTA